MIPTRSDLSLDAHTIQIAATAGLSSLPACALRLDLASQYLCLAADSRVAAFLEELGRRRHGISFQPNHLVFQTLAEAAIESIAEAPRADVGRLAALVLHGARHDLDVSWISRAACLHPLDWRLADLYAKTVGRVAVNFPDQVGETLATVVRHWAPPSEIETSLRRLQELGILARDNDLPLDPAQPYLPPAPITADGERLLRLASTESSVDQDLQAPVAAKGIGL
jgi:hypothetical protein